MRSIVLGALAVALAGCNPYDPNLPAVPFRCGTVDPLCPGGYACNAGLCEEILEGPDARPVPTDARCLDQAEPNDMINMATILPVFDQQPAIPLSGLILCQPVAATDDKDYFRITQPQVCGSPNPDCPDLSALVRWDNTMAPAPKIEIQTATGVVVQISGGTGNPGEVKAILPNASQGTWYVVVLPMAGESIDYYELDINDP